MLRGELCVIDWKKSDKDKPTLESTYDAPVQVSAYVGAVNASSLYPFTVIILNLATSRNIALIDYE